MDEHAKLERLLNIILLLAGGRTYTLGELCDRLDISTRTIHRYLSTIRSTGFIIEVSNGLYKIPKLEKPFKELKELLHFSEEEAYILTRAIHSIDDSNLLKANLVSKLYSLYNFDRVAETVVKPENISTINDLIRAIRENRQVLLRQYRSSHGRLVRDRLLEPFDFTTNYQFVWAFEPESRTCKLFKTSRIGSVEVLEQEYLYTEMHLKLPVDVFRISSQQQVRVVLNLSLRAFNLLTEEFPLAEQFVKPLTDNIWQFDATVCGFEGVGRFVIGLGEEIEVVESKEFKVFLKEKLKKIENKF